MAGAVAAGAIDTNAVQQIAGGAAVAGVRNPRQSSLFGILFNVGLALVMYTFISSKRGTKAGNAANSTRTVDSQGATHLHSSAANEIPVAAPATTEATGGPAGNMFAMMGLPDPSTYIKGVPPELAGVEAARAASLAAVPAQARLYPLWRPGQRFSLFIYVSTSVAPIADWSEASRVAAAFRTGERTEFDSEADDVPAEASRNAAPTRKAVPYSLFGGMMQRLLATSTGSPPPVRLRNSSFTLPAPETSDGSGVSTRLLWAQHGLTLDWAPGVAREQSFAVTLPAAVLRNESGVYAHVLAVAEGAPPAPPGVAGHVAGSALYSVHALVSQLKRKRAKATFNLLGNEPTASATPRSMAFGIGATPTPADDAAVDDAAVDNAADASDEPGSIRYLPHWRPTLHLQLVGDQTVYPTAKGLPPHISATMVIDAAVSPPGGYLPLAWVNDFWLLQSNLIALNETMALPGTQVELPLTVSYSTATMMVWSLQATMASQWAAQEAMGTSGAGESDMLKKVLLETNPVLLAVTFTVSLLHMVFEFLAFRADVSFWRAAKSMEGVSVRSLFVTLFSQTVILLCT